MKEEKCVICRRPADIRINVNNDDIQINCAHCGRVVISRECYEDNIEQMSAEDCEVMSTYLTKTNRNPKRSNSPLYLKNTSFTSFMQKAIRFSQET